MQILLANAKIMRNVDSPNPFSMPQWQGVANALATEMSTLSVEDLAKQLDCSKALAAENWLRYQQFHDAKKLPALMAYHGQAYKHLRAQTLSAEALKFAQQHLWITCFLYGLLRPLDGIVPYRMEHCVKLETTHNLPVNRFWKGLLTDALIESVKADDGILLHLSTEEYEHLFDWNRVGQEVKVIQPLFYVRRDGKLKMQAVWAKSCRGAMVRYALENKLLFPDEIVGFEYEGFRFDPTIGDETHPIFVRDDD